MAQPNTYGVSGDKPPQPKPLPPVEGIKELNPRDLDETIAQDKLVMVEFYTLHCSACRMFDMTMGKVSDTLRGKVDLYRVNDPDLDISRTRFGIPGYPSTVFFYKGNVVGSIIGAMEWKYFAPQLKKILTNHLINDVGLTEITAALPSV